MKRIFRIYWKNGDEQNVETDNDSPIETVALQDAMEKSGVGSSDHIDLVRGWQELTEKK